MSERIPTWQDVAKFFPRERRVQRIVSDESFQDWLDRKLSRNRNLSPASVRSYVSKLAEFSEYIRMSPTEILQDVKQAKREDDLVRWRDKLDRWNRKLVNEVHSSQKTAREKLVVVAGFLSSFDIKLDYQFPALPETKEVAVPSRETIKRIYDSVRDPELRAFIVFAKDSGLLEADLMNLDVDFHYYDKLNKIHHESIREQLLKDQWPIFIVIDREKTGYLTKTFLGEESRKHIQITGNRIYPWSSDYGIRRLFRRYCDQLGFSLELRELRHFFGSALAAVDMSDLQHNVMMGHKIRRNDINRFYVAFSREKLQPKYIEAYKYLKLFPQDV